MAWRRQWRVWSSARVAVLVVAGLASSPAPAAAHALLVRSQPAAGAVVSEPPRAVLLIFDEGVRPAPGIAVVHPGEGSVVAGKPYVPAGNPREIVIPLRGGLGSGPYAVRWSEIDVDDGHLISGAFVFAVGSGLPPAQPAAAAGGPPFSAIASKWLLLVGIALAAGIVGFELLVWGPVRRRHGLAAEASGVVQAVGLAAALGVAALGAFLSVALQPGTAGSRFGDRMEAGAVLAAAGAAAAIASLRIRPLRALPGLIAVALLGLPTATGHASAPGPPHALSVPADLVHLAAAAVWLGGSLHLVGLAPLALRKLGRGERALLYRALVRRYAPIAVAAVALLAASGVARAVSELTALDQLWTTGYGRALLVKTGVFGGLLALAWLNRYRLVPQLGAGAPGPGAGVRRLRGSVGGELALLVVALGAVAVLTEARPGRDYTQPAAAASTPQPDRTVVLAGEDDDLAVGLAMTPQSRTSVRLRATVLGLRGPVGGLDVRFLVASRTATRAAAAACGAGCYRATATISGRPTRVALRIAGRGRVASTLAFAAPARWPAAPATGIVRRAERAIRALRTLVVRSRLASDSRHEVTTVYRMVAPNRLAYENVGGSETVIIGDRRWDREPGARWVAAPQWPPIRQPAPFWPPGVTHAHLLRTARIDGRPVWVVSFLDPGTPAWFTAWVDRSTFRTLRLEMIATAHFMHDRDGPFDSPITIEPPRR